MTFQYKKLLPCLSSLSVLLNGTAPAHEKQKITTGNTYKDIIFILKARKIVIITLKKHKNGHWLKRKIRLKPRHDFSVRLRNGSNSADFIQFRSHSGNFFLYALMQTENHCDI